MNNLSDDLENSFDQSQDDTQFLIDLFGTLKRQKKYFFTVALASFLFTGLIFITRQKIWQGEFQIVISEKKKKNPKDTLMSNSQNMLSLVGIGSNKNRLFTEVKILESPSVLMPVFDFVNKYYNEEYDSNLNFKSWMKNNLSIEVLRKTSILNITYKDKNRELVSEVLKNLSQTYQNYSSRDRNKGINQSIKYLDSQIELYKFKSQESLKAEQEFSTENDLSIFLVEDRTITNDIKQQLNVLKAFEKPTKVNTQINVEVLRVRYSNILRELKSKLEQVQTLNDSNKGDFILRQTLLPELAQRARYKSWKDEAKIYLNAKIVATNAKLSSLERPKDVLIKYRELLRETKRANNILKMLEEKKQRILLEKAQAEDPWEVISSPNVSKKPVSPSKKSYFIFGVFSSFILGSITSKFVENRKGVIYSINELKRIIPATYLGLVNLEKSEESGSVIDKIIQNSLKDKKNIGILLAGFDKNDIDIKSLNKSYESETKSKTILFTNNIDDINQYAQHLIITKLGGISRDEISSIRQHYMITDKKIAGHLIC